MEQRLGDILKSLPPKPFRSRLAPYSELIDELRKSGWTYRDIAGILYQKCGVRVCASNLHHFVNSRKVKLKPNTPPRPMSASIKEQHSQVTPKPPSQSKNPDEVTRRLQALKDRAATLAQDNKIFEYDESKPLNLKSRRDL